MKRDLCVLKSALLSSCALALTGCMSLAAIEPVKNPPVNYQADVSVQVEFLSPASVGPRCADRGVSMFGVPMPGAMACANQRLMTLPAPCDLVTGGWYAEALCKEIAHSRGWEPPVPGTGARLMTASWSPDQAYGRRAEPAGRYRGDAAIWVEFVDAEKIGLRCAERGAVAFGQPTLNALSCSNSAMMTLPNPCSVVDGGWYADLLCHEMGHANGWAANHPGGSFLKDGRSPAPHSAPTDDSAFVESFFAAAARAQLNLERGDPVRATVLASLADSEAAASEIALRSGVRQNPDFALPRPLAAPRRMAASVIVPAEPARLRAGPDFSEPMGPFAARRSGTRLTRTSLDQLFSGAFEAGAALLEKAAAMESDSARSAAAAAGQTLLNVAYAPAQSTLPGTGRISLRARFRAMDAAALYAGPDPVAGAPADETAVPASSPAGHGPYADGYGRHGLNSWSAAPVTPLLPADD